MFQSIVTRYDKPVPNTTSFENSDFIVILNWNYIFLKYREEIAYDMNLMIRRIVLNILLFYDFLKWHSNCFSMEQEIETQEK